MNNIDILEEDVKNILNCCTDIETLISLDERAKEDLKNNTHNIQQQEVLTIIREFIRCKNDCSNLIAENKELKEMLKHRIEYTNKLEKDLFQNASNYVIPKSKLKAKIEEVEQWGLYNMKIPKLSTLDERLGAKIGIKYVLQSLLGKE